MKEIFIKKYWDEENILFYLHFQDKECVRQIEIKEGNYIFLSKENPEQYLLIADKDFDESDYNKEDFIAKEEFEIVWNKK